MLVPVAGIILGIAIILCILGSAFAATGSVSGTDNPFWPFEPGIPDQGTLHRTITISNAPSGSTITKVVFECRVVHDYHGDLRIWYGLSDRSVTVYNREGGSDSGALTITKTEYSEFDGKSPNQTWNAYFQDCALADTGHLDYWEITVYYETDTTPPTPPGTPYIDAAYDTGRYNNDRITNIDKPLFRWTASTDSGSGTKGYRVSYTDSTPDNLSLIHI